MGQLVYQFFDSVGHVSTIDIQLLDTPFIHRWCNYMNQLSERTPNILWYFTRLNSNHRYLQPESLVGNFARLHAAFDFFHSRGLEDFSKEFERIEYLFIHPNNLEQRDLNVWHRHFTSLAGKYTFNSDLIPKDSHMMDIYKYIQQINQYVHLCEGYTYADCPRRQIFDGPDQYSIQFTNANHLSSFADNDNKKVWEDSVELEEGIYDCFQESFDHSVWLQEDIIGKDQIKAWLDGDDLTKSDITGNKVMTPNVMFDPNKLFPRVIDNISFRSESKNSKKTLDRLPLGDITNLEAIDWNLILNSRVFKIELNNKVLWYYV